MFNSLIFKDNLDKPSLDEEAGLKNKISMILFTARNYAKCFIM